MDIGIDITRSPGGSQERVDLLADHIPEECDDELCLSLISGLGCHDEETCVYMLQEDTIGVHALVGLCARHHHGAAARVLCSTPSYFLQTQIV